MTTRINGYIQVGAENVSGDNGFLSFVVEAGTPIAVTGVTATLEQLLALKGVATYAELVGTPTQPTDHDGALIASDADYVIAYSAQENLTRLVNFVQQRGVIMASSVIATGTTSVVGGNDFDEVVTGNALTFMVQDSEAFYHSAPTFGVPQVETLDVLRAGLRALDMLDGTGVIATSLRTLALNESVHPYIA